MESRGILRSLGSFFHRMYGLESVLKMKASSTGSRTWLRLRLSFLLNILRISALENETPVPPSGTLKSLPISAIFRVE